MENKRLKRVLLFVIGIVAILAMALVAIEISKPNGTSISEREKLLRENSACKRMNIATELQLDNYILCGIYDENKAGIAIFELSGKGYKLKRIELRGKSRVISSTEYLNGEWYQLTWFNGADTKTVKIIIINIDNNDIIMEQSYDVSDGNIVAFKEPNGLKNFSLSIVYYDADGKSYE